MSRALMRHLEAAMHESIVSEGIRVVPNEENLGDWTVEFAEFAMESGLFESLLAYDDLTGHGLKVVAQVLFPPDFPSSPPFVRIVRPRFHQYSGHVTVGGSICVEDLTKSGWNAENDVVGVLVMVRSLLESGGALVNCDDVSDYSMEEARSAFSRVAVQHGWTP